MKESDRELIIRISCWAAYALTALCPATLGSGWVQSVGKAGILGALVTLPLYWTYKTHDYVFLGSVAYVASLLCGITFVFKEGDFPSLGLCIALIVGGSVAVIALTVAVLLVGCLLEPLIKGGGDDEKS